MMRSPAGVALYTSFASGPGCTHSLWAAVAWNGTAPIASDTRIVISHGRSLDLLMPSLRIASRRAKRGNCTDRREGIEGLPIPARTIERLAGDPSRIGRGENQPQHVEVEHLVKMFRGNVFKRHELVDAGVVDEDIERAEGFFCFGEKAADVGLFREIGLHRDRLAAVALDLADDSLGALP